MNTSLEKPIKSPASRLVKKLKKGLNNQYMSFVRWILRDKYYIQSHPAHHVKMDGIPGFDALELAWSQDRESFETDRVRLYVLTLLYY